MVKTKRKQTPTSIYLSTGDKAILVALRRRLGLGPTAILRQGLRMMANDYGLLTRDIEEVTDAS